MLMLHQHILRYLIALFVVTLCLTSMVSYITLKDTNIQQYRHALESHIKFIKHQLPTIEQLDDFAKMTKESIDIRMTLIDENGVVLVDSDKENGMMDNHARR